MKTVLRLPWLATLCSLGCVLLCWSVSACCNISIFNDLMTYWRICFATGWPGCVDDGLYSWRAGNERLKAKWLMNMNGNMTSNGHVVGSESKTCGVIMHLISLANNYERILWLLIWNEGSAAARHCVSLNFNKLRHLYIDLAWENGHGAIANTNVTKCRYCKPPLNRLHLVKIGHRHNIEKKIKN